jgi:hypothetical protein
MRCHETARRTAKNIDRAAEIPDSPQHAVTEWLSEVQTGGNDAARRAATLCEFEPPECPQATPQRHDRRHSAHHDRGSRANHQPHL